MVSKFYQLIGSYYLPDRTEKKCWKKEGAGYTYFDFDENPIIGRNFPIIME